MGKGRWHCSYEGKITFCVLNLELEYFYFYFCIFLIIFVILVNRNVRLCFISGFKAATCFFIRVFSSVFVLFATIM
jgi:hypothetical protein